MSASAVQAELGFNVPPRGESLDLRFSRWCQANPKAIRVCVEIARELRDAGHSRISMDMVFHVARYRQIVARVSGERWRLNNTHTSRMARLLEANYPDLRGCFETRALADERAQ